MDQVEAATHQRGAGTDQGEAGTHHGEGWGPRLHPRGSPVEAWAPRLDARGSPPERRTPRLDHEGLEASRPRIKARRGRIEGRPYGSKFLLPSYAPLVRTTKISIAIDKEHLRLARKAAISEGLSLSGYIARALSSRLEDQRRIDAARELQASWGPESLPTPGDRERFLTRMSRGRRKRRARAA